MNFVSFMFCVLSVFYCRPEDKALSLRMFPLDIIKSARVTWLLQGLDSVVGIFYVALILLFCSDCSPSRLLSRPALDVEESGDGGFEDDEGYDFAEVFFTSDDDTIPPPGRSGGQLKLRTSTRQLRKVAESYLGVRYLYGGTTRRGMDCSGFVWRVFRQLGSRHVPRSSSRIFYRQSKVVKVAFAKPGDLVFFARKGKIFHVGIYMGKKKFIHASLERGVCYSKLDEAYYRKHFIGTRRLFVIGNKE